MTTRYLVVAAALALLAACGGSSDTKTGMQDLCVANVACASTNPCKVAATSCASATAAAVCTDIGNALAGTDCGAGGVCSNGSCVAACTGNQACQTENPCTFGLTTCSGPAAQLTCSTTGVKPDLSTCGTGQVCIGGSCITQLCDPVTPAACQPADPCATGTVVCAEITKPGTCQTSGVKADGAACGSGQVCAAGACVAACQADQACTIPGSPCARGATACATAWAAPTCANVGALPNGTACGTDKSCTGGTCAWAVQPSVVSFTAAPATIGPGGAATLAWSVSSADSIQIEPGLGRVTDGSAVVTPSVTTTYTLIASNTAGLATANTTVTVRPVPAIVSFTASPAAVAPGSAVVLGWSVTGADSLTIDPGVGAVTGTSVTVTPTTTTTYTLTARNAVGGASLQATVVVRALPVITVFAASPDNVLPGAAATLSWSVTGADQLTIDQGVGVVASTSRQVNPARTTTYTLTATSPSGSVTASATVAVSTITRVYVRDVTVVAGQTVTMTPDVTVGIGSPGLELDWTVAAGSLGSISPSRGRTTTYTAPFTPGKYQVWGTSVWDPTKRDYCNVTVVAAPSIGGIITGLQGGGLTLASPGQPNLLVPAGATSFTFAIRQAIGSSYAVAVVRQPNSPAQVCWVTGGAGTAGEQDVTTVEISCHTAWWKVAAGAGHTIAIRPDGTLWSWGSNYVGQLGDGTTRDRLAPVFIGSGFVQVTAGSNHTMAVKSDGTLWAWGLNSYGKLCGAALAFVTTTPTQIGAGFAKAAAGAEHSVARKLDGTLWSCGRNDNGELGDGTTTNRSTLTQIGAGYTDVAAGGLHTVAIKADGTLWAWGYNPYGQVGDGTTANRRSPVWVGAGFMQASGGWLHTVAVKTDGSVWSWGNNYNGQLGDGTTSNRLTPVQIATGFGQAAAGEAHTVALDADGTVWAWGGNGGGQLGDGTTTDRLVPVPIAARFTQLAAGSGHTVALRTDDTMWAWGSNVDGQLGIDGGDVQKESPVPVP